MKIFVTEFQKNYQTYSFGYAVYCLMESRAEIPDIYDRGFLPYSGNIKLDPQVFYMARSLRCDLSRFVDSSENKRVARKVADLGISLSIQDKSDYLEDSYFSKFCMDYASQRFSNGAMDSARFTYLLKREIGSHIYAFSLNEEPIGYVYVIRNGDMLHYWFSFFNLEYLKPHSIGKWIMWQVLSWAKASEYKYVYLGTCYGNHSLYKVRDFKGLEYWDGTCWCQDMHRLKKLCKTDEEVHDRDQFKLNPNQEAYLEALCSQ